MVGEGGLGKSPTARDLDQVYDKKARFMEPLECCLAQRKASDSALHKLSNRPKVYDPHIYCFFHALSEFVLKIH